MKLPYSKARPLSWSAISAFQWNKESWFKKYCLGEKDPETAEMKFGKVIGEKLATDSKFLPCVPRLGKYEHELRVMLGDIPLIGYMDDFCAVTQKKMQEFKTGVKIWDQKRADEHGQITMYLLMHYITTKIRPEEMDVNLIWLPTKRFEGGDFDVKISFVEPIKDTMKIFKTKRTTTDILKFGAFIKDIYKQMGEYIEKLSPAELLKAR